MTLLDAVKSFGPKITENYRETRFCDFAPPDETVGVIDVSASGNGSRGIAFLIDSMIVKLDGAARRIDYRDIRVMETLPSYETPFEDELLIASPAGYFMAPVGEERIGDVSNVLFSNGWIADDDGKVFIYYASSDTRMHVATSTIERLVDYCLHTPQDGFSSSASVEILKNLIERNLRLMK